jgi:hypothetical protein
MLEEMGVFSIDERQSWCPFSHHLAPVNGKQTTPLANTSPSTPPPLPSVPPIASSVEMIWCRCVLSPACVGGEAGTMEQNAREQGPTPRARYEWLIIASYRLGPLLGLEDAHQR